MGKISILKEPPVNIFSFWKTWLFTFAWRPKMAKWPT